MKNLKVLVTLIVIGLLLSPSMALAQGVKGSGNVLVFDKAKFAAVIKENQLGAGILGGYAAVMIKGGNVVGEVAGGFAIRGDDNLKQALMTTSTPNDIGSDAKMLSFTMLLAEFEKRAAQNPSNTVAKQLNQSILPYLPRAWRNCINQSANKNTAQDAAIARIGKVTFAQLMSHKSGFRALSGIPFNYITFGIQQKDVGVRVYCNFNATVVTYLLPGLVNAGMAEQFDNQLQKTANNNAPVYGKLYGDFYENWMQKNVFDKITPRIRPSCDPGVDFPKRNPAVTFARYYKNGLGGTGAQFWSEKDNNYGCHAQGGYYIGMRDLAAFMATFQATDTLITENTRKLMYDDSTSATQDARLGWDKTMVSEFATKHFGVKRLPWHGGLNLGYTAIVRFPGGYIGVGTHNDGSTGKTGGDIANALNEAWAAALEAN